MDAIIRQVVQEEISCQKSNEQSQRAAASYSTSNSSPCSTSVIRQAVQEEISRQNKKGPGESAASSTHACNSATSNSSQRSTVSRLSALLNRIRGQSKGKKRKIDKEHQIQIQGIHYSEKSQAFIPVCQKNSGGNHFVSYGTSEAPTVEDLKDKASALFFPGGKSPFAGQVHNSQVMELWIVT